MRQSTFRPFLVPFLALLGALLVTGCGEDQQEREQALVQAAMLSDAKLVVERGHLASTGGGGPTPPLLIARLVGGSRCSPQRSGERPVSAARGEASRSAS